MKLTTKHNTRSKAMTENTTYNGWKNYETWATSLWIGNEHGIYNDVFETCNNEKNNDCLLCPSEEYNR